MSVIIDLIHKRINRENKNWLAIVCGPTGGGKSYSALHIAKVIDPEFNIDRVVFTAEDFMKLLNSGKLHKGNVIIWDEAGVGMPAREWYSVSNKVISYILQTFRRENLGVIFTTPSFDFIDSQARKLFHAYMETMNINREEKFVTLKYMIIQNNPKEGKVYIKYPRIKVNGRKKTLMRMDVNKPEKELVKAHEKKKKEFSNKLKKDTEGILNDAKERRNRNGKAQNLDTIVKKVMTNITYYTRHIGKKSFIDKPLIMAELEIGKVMASKVVSMIEAKKRKKLMG